MTQAVVVAVANKEFKVGKSKKRGVCLDIPAKGEQWFDFFDNFPEKGQTIDAEIEPNKNDQYNDVVRNFTVVGSSKEESAPTTAYTASKGTSDRQLSIIRQSSIKVAADVVLATGSYDNAEEAIDAIIKLADEKIVPYANV